MRRGHLRCCVKSSYHGSFCCCQTQALGTQASVFVALGLNSCGSKTLEHTLTGVVHGRVALQHVGSSQTRDQAQIPCIGRWIITEPPGKPWTGVFWWWPWVGFSVTEMNPHLAGTRRFSSPKSDGEAGARVVPGVSSRERERKHQGKLKQVSWEGILFCVLQSNMCDQTALSACLHDWNRLRGWSRDPPSLLTWTYPERRDWKLWFLVVLHLIKALRLSLTFPKASLVAQLVKNLPHNVGDPSMIPESRRSPEEGKGYPLQYSGLENSWGHKESDMIERLSHFSNIF